MESSFSNLLCTEDDGFLNEEEEREEEDRFFSIHSTLSIIEDEYIELLVEKESTFQSRDDKSSSDNFPVESWLLRSRLDAVRWMLEMREFLGLRFQTAYLSVSYLDRFLSRRSVDNGKAWAIWLLSIACLSLAAKMEEHKALPLSKFRVEEFDFESRAIQRAELLILNVLEWRMSSVTPFAFLAFFARKLCDKPRPRGLLCNAIELIAEATEVINVTEYRPSAMAAAAILATSNQQLTRKSMDLKMGSIALCGSSSIINESVFPCYKLMKELALEKQLRTSKIDISTDLSSIQWRTASVPSTGCKRKLAFDDDGLKSHELDYEKTD